jgi:hypothetical protein
VIQSDLQALGLGSDLHGLPCQFGNAAVEMTNVDLNIVDDDGRTCPALLGGVQAVLLARPFDGTCLYPPRNRSEVQHGAFGRRPCPQWHAARECADDDGIRAIRFRALYEGIAEAAHGARIGNHDIGASRRVEGESEIEAV